MYRLPHYDESRYEILCTLIDAHPFATLIVNGGSGILANHVPVLLRREATTAGTLVGHIARANPVWRNVESGSRSLLIFQGGDHYISPRWYRSAQADGKGVPTWDYSVVHAHGPIQWIDDRAWLLALLGDMTAAFEHGCANPWRPEEMPADYRDSMLGGIVGFQIPIDSLQGKFKLNQRSTPDDRNAVIIELRRIGSDSATAMAEAIEKAGREDE
jgi:transcriptional regulator